MDAYGNKSDLHFNPRSREGSDDPNRNPYDSRAISIHAPAKGATGDYTIISVEDIISIHAPAKGATIPVYINCIIFLFQSTLPRRERQYFGCYPVLESIFQSTLPRRERPGYSRSVNAQLPISIHAPAKGATLIISCSLQAGCISIHAPAKGATQTQAGLVLLSTYFNPRSREGSDVLSSVALTAVYNFNPRSREGSDCLQNVKTQYLSHFNPRSREGSDL